MPMQGMMWKQHQQQQLLIDHQASLKLFDSAVNQGSIQFAPTEPISLGDNGFEAGSLLILSGFQFRICPQFHHKPGLPPADAPTNPTKSDIPVPPSLHITTVPPSHDLALNAYPILRPSYLLLTTSPLERQTSPLSLADIVVARKALAGLVRDTLSDRQHGDCEEGCDFIVIYNSGRASGCSRLHKHMQLLPRPSRASFSLFPDRPCDNPVNVPYVYDLIRHDPSSSSSSPPIDKLELSDHIFNSYTHSLNRFRTLLDLQSGEEPVPHNVIMTREWTVIIPRRRAGVDGISTNAAGMMGMVWVGKEGQVEQWKRLGPWTVLGELGVKAEVRNHDD